MKVKFIFMIFMSLIMVTAGVAGGRTLALFTASTAPTNANFQALDAGEVKLIAWRHLDTVPGPNPPEGVPPVTHIGWADGPMFYVTPEQGATPDPWQGSPQPPSWPRLGERPTGVWAPGDSHTRWLDIRNAGNIEALIHHFKVILYHEGGPKVSPPAADLLALAENFDLTIRAPLGNNDKFNVWTGSLADAARSWQEMVDSQGGDFLRVPGSRDLHLEFIITMNKNAGNIMQGQTLKADFWFYGEQGRNNPRRPSK